MKETVASLYGVVRLAARDPDGLNHLDLTVEGFWRSFFAALVALPLFLVEREIARGIVAALDPGKGIAPLGADLAVYLLDWPLSALVLLGVTWILGRTDRFALLVIAMNWLAVVSLGILCVTELVVLAAPAIFTPFMMVVHLAILVIEFRVARIALGAGIVPAVGVVIVANLFENLFPVMAFRLLG